MKRFFESKALDSVNEKKPETLPPAIKALDQLLTDDPTYSDGYLMRAQIGCISGRSPQANLADIAWAIDTHSKNALTAFSTLQGHYALKSKIEFDLADYDAAIRDLEKAEAEDFESASEIFNDGTTKPTNGQKPCVWTKAAVRKLIQKRPADRRPEFFAILYDLQFLKWNLDSDYSQALKDLKRLSETWAGSPHPDFTIGALYSSGRLGGMISTASSKCIESLQPRTTACLTLDELHQTGMRAFTAAIAKDQSFGPAYAGRANVLLHLKEYRQAIRDYDKAIELLHGNSKSRRTLLNDRGIAKYQAGDLRGAIDDYSQSIAIGCIETCGSYQNRAKAYFDVGDYENAVKDWSKAINLVMSYQAFTIRIDRFRALYPEYDLVPDSVLTERLRTLFEPEMSSEMFAKQFLIDAQMEPTFVLVDFYMQRGDAYVKLKDAERADADYGRVLKVFPKFAEPYFTTIDGKPVRNQEKIGGN